VLHNNLRLLIIGDGPERATLERFARLASDLDHIRFLGHRDDVWRIMPHLDVFWNGSGYEGQPNAVMEAMAAGIPVIASDIPGNRELIVHGESGLLVPIAGRAARARTTDQIFTDPALAARLSAAAQRRMLEHFGIEQNIERHAQMYREMLG
jgi:glycosyltransferase involved in cell wall biosynthesis